MFQIAIIASGGGYTSAARETSATFQRLKKSALVFVSIWIPEFESQGDDLRSLLSQEENDVRRFPLKLVSTEKFTSQLKCQGFLHFFSSLQENEIGLVVDADTFCLRPFCAEDLNPFVGQGRVALVPDIKDRHANDPASSWHVPPFSTKSDGALIPRPPYFNSGVIAAKRDALDIFQKIYDTSFHPDFLRGPFNDQKVVNYVLGKYFPDRVSCLPPRFNSLGQLIQPDTIIGHWCGGAGGFNRSDCQRRKLHSEWCQKAIRSIEPSSPNLIPEQKIAS